MLEELKANGYEIVFESHAVAILDRDFPSALGELETVLKDFEIPITEIIGSGGARQKERKDFAERSPLKAGGRPTSRSEKASGSRKQTRRPSPYNWNANPSPPQPERCSKLALCRGPVEASLLLQCDISIAGSYASQSQRSRVISEAWFRSFGYCLSCDSSELRPTAANTRASDFVCPECRQSYELKTFGRKPKRSLVDGAYSAMISRIIGGDAPTLMLLERSPTWDIRSLTAVHGSFLTPSVIVQRKPLSPGARRAGWVGCNIRLDLIAADAQIALVNDGRANKPEAVRAAFRQFNRLGELSVNARGWATLTLRVIRSLGASNFSLGDLYRREFLFSSVYPENHNVRAKIRQQLQVLRDMGYLDFCGGGTYRLLIGDARS